MAHVNSILLSTIFISTALAASACEIIQQSTADTATDSRFPQFHDTSENGYKVTTDAATIQRRFAPLVVESGTSVAASKTHPRDLPNPEPQYWYHAVLKLDAESQKKIKSLPLSESAPMPALHPELFDDVPAECTFMRLDAADTPSQQDIEQAIFTQSDENRMFFNAGAYCPENGLLLLDTWGVSGS